MRPSIATIAVLLALAGCSKDPAETLAPDAPIAAVAPPAGKQWTEVVSATPDGGYVMGNPNAAVKLVEYAAYSCPHCKVFAGEGIPALKADYVASGKLSYEMRPFLIHGAADVVTTLLAECRGPDYFFPLSEQLFAAQDEWLGKLIAVPAAEQQRWQDLAPADRFRAIVDAAGLRAFFAARGLPAAQADKCLADQKAGDRIVEVTNKATTDLQVTGTPSFFINGQLQDNVADWKTLEPRLKSAIG